MKFLDFFLARNILYALIWKDIAFYVSRDAVKPYNSASATIRTHCYDVMAKFQSMGFKACLYIVPKDYKVVIITKSWDTKTVNLVKKLKKKGVKVIYDIFYDDWGNPDRIVEEKNVIDISSMADRIITVSEIQKNYFRSVNSEVTVIPEAISRDITAVIKKHIDKSTVNVIYCGYADKSFGLLEIAGVLNELSRKGVIRLIIVAEKNPNHTQLEYEYIRYEQKKIASIMCQGDIAIAPRKKIVDRQYSNSVMKIAMPMAVGLPVLATRVNAYENTPCILCDEKQEWENKITELALSTELRDKIGKLGKEYVNKNLSIDKIANEYLKVIADISKNEDKCDE